MLPAQIKPESTATKRFSICRSSGAALLGIVASLGVFTLLFAAIYPSYHFALQNYAVFQARLKASSLLVRALDSIQFDTALANSISGLANIQVHPPGQLTTTSGVNVDSTDVSTAFSPHLASNPISFRHLALHKSLVITQAQNQLGGIEIRACGVQPSVAHQDIWLIISPVGHFQSFGTLRRTRTHSVLCASPFEFKGTLRTRSDPIFEDTLASSNQLSTPLLLVPIEQTFTLYVDHDKTLRRVSHNSRENQPIALSLGRLEIVPLNNNSNATLYRVSGSIDSPIFSQPIHHSILIKANHYDPYAILNLLR